ncbi:MAG: hypothetical protein ABI862_17735, partial [Ilumatobacteraceae bacterium]
MAAVTPLQALPVPSLTDPPNGPGQMLALATALEKKLVMYFATVAARTAAIPVPTKGMVSYIGATDSLSTHNGVAWVELDGRYAPIPTAWTAPALLNGWVNFGGAGNQVLQYRKNGDNVEIRGVVKSGTIASPLFLLPVGFRPPAGTGYTPV